MLTSSFELIERTDWILATPRLIRNGIRWQSKVCIAQCYTVILKIRHGVAHVARWSILGLLSTGFIRSITAVDINRDIASVGQARIWLQVIGLVIIDVLLRQPVARPERGQVETVFVDDIIHPVSIANTSRVVGGKAFKVFLAASSLDNVALDYAMRGQNRAL